MHRKSLTAIANACQTDKGTVHAEGHGYTCVYETLFGLLRDSPINLLEIGLQQGGPEVGGCADRETLNVPSVRMWLEYFSKAHIFGLDISDFHRFQTERFSFLQADCGNPAALDSIAASGRRYQIIIDDGSHASYHQQLTFLKLFPALEHGGLYIIEDLQWQPREYEMTLPAVPKTVDLFANFMEQACFENTGALSSREWNDIALDIGHVLLFSADYLTSQRRLYNKREGLRPDRIRYMDEPRLGHLGQFRRLLEGAAALINTSLARAGPSWYNRVILAIVSKL